MNWVYILRCFDGSLYTGWTNNLEKRIAEHGRGRGAKYTRSRLPVEVVYYEIYQEPTQARKREAAIKKLSRKEKLELIGLDEKKTPEGLNG
ncbi:MAG: GIY-YIG nuclease family protein [Tissierellia bacterium]|nr:GIY-YIG nuclease family protein [Tissierellia bacterium]